MYYEVFENQGGWRWKIYRYDDSGNEEVRVATSAEVYREAAEAVDAVCEYAEAEGLDVELA